MGGYIGLGFISGATFRPSFEFLGLGPGTSYANLCLEMKEGNAIYAHVLLKGPAKEKQAPITSRVDALGASV